VDPVAQLDLVVVESERELGHLRPWAGRRSSRCWPRARGRPWPRSCRS
jgi:hypothetical protein